MVRKTIGIILMIVAVIITVLLVTRGGTIVPHIIGPITLAIIGVFLLTRGKKAESPAK